MPYCLWDYEKTFIKKKKIYNLYKEKLKKKLNKILAEVTGKDITTIDNDTERDYFMDSMEALNYGIVDKILK